MRVDLAIPLTLENQDAVFDIGLRFVQRWGGAFEGAGSGFGMRDMQFLFPSPAEAEQAAQQIREELEAAGLLLPNGFGIDPIRVYQPPLEEEE